MSYHVVHLKNKYYLDNYRKLQMNIYSNRQKIKGKLQNLMAVSELQNH